VGREESKSIPSEVLPINRKKTWLEKTRRRIRGWLSSEARRKSKGGALWGKANLTRINTPQTIKKVLNKQGQDLSGGEKRSRTRSISRGAIILS